MLILVLVLQPCHIPRLLSRCAYISIGIAAMPHAIGSLADVLILVYCSHATCLGSLADVLILVSVLQPCHMPRLLSRCAYISIGIAAMQHAIGSLADVLILVLVLQPCHMPRLLSRCAYISIGIAAMPHA